MAFLSARNFAILASAVFVSGCCDEAALYEAVQSEVVKLLVSPASAVFPAIGEITATRSENVCAVRYSGFVDAQNSFGAMLRTNFNGHAMVAELGKIEARAWVMP
jgi:hypothetical protein